jgi:hypothetical protein
MNKKKDMAQQAQNTTRMRARVVLRPRATAKRRVGPRGAVLRTVSLAEIGSE